MLPMLAAMPIASSLVSGLFNSLAPHSHVSQSSGKSEFNSQLLTQMGNTHSTTAMDRIGSIHGLIALQQGMGPLQPEIQLSLANQLLHQNVQVVDKSGNNVVGTVTEAHMDHGQVQITVKGQNYPLTSLQAILHQV
jgi:hypothetical protein